MEITQITYRRLKNLGNYESEAVEMTGTVERGDSIVDVFHALKSCVLESLDLLPVAEVDPSEDF